MSEQPRNPYLCLTIVLILGAIGLLGMGGLLLLTLYDKRPGGEIIALIAGAVGSLSSFLVQVPRNQIGGGSIDAPRADPVRVEVSAKP